MLSLIVACIAVFFASLLGGMALAAVKITHRKLQMLVSMVAGLMLGVAMLHLLPASTVKLPDPQYGYVIALIGLLAMFFLVRLFDFHQHSVVESEKQDEPHPECDHDHHGHSGKASWAGLVAGLTIHSLLDGFALAAAVDTQHAGLEGMFASLGILLAIALHKPLDGLMVTTVMLSRNFSKTKILVANVLFALTAPVGALLLYAGTFSFADSPIQNYILGGTLAFSAGVFLCISLGDLLPELHFHDHDRLLLSGMLILGVIIAVLVELIPGHSHTHASYQPIKPNTAASYSSTMDPGANSELRFSTSVHNRSIPS